MKDEESSEALEFYLAEQTAKRVAEIFDEGECPIEMFTTLIEKILEGYAVIIDVERRKIHCFLNGTPFDFSEPTKRVQPCKGYQPRSHTF